MNPEGSKYPYREAIILHPTINKNGKDIPDISKRWCIEFYAWNIRTNKLQRVRRDFDINKFDTIKSRKDRAKEYLDIINKDLRDGYFLDPTIRKKPKSNFQQVEPEVKETETIISPTSTIIASLTYANKIKNKGKRKDTINSYNSKLNVFSEWLEESEFDINIQIKHFHTIHLDSFFNYLIDDREVENKTYNNYYEWLSALFVILQGRKVIVDNPCKAIDKLKVEEAYSLSFTKEHIDLLKIELPKKDEQLWKFTQFIYYTLARPKELRLLKIKHIEEKKIFIPSNISKNKKNGHVVITNGLRKIIDSMELHKYNSEDFIFSVTGSPGPKGVSKNHFTKIHLEVLTEHKFSEDYDMYKWKHTGAKALCLAGVNVKFVQLQLRHTSLEMTDRYLRSLGVQMDAYIDNEIISKAPII